MWGDHVQKRGHIGVAARSVCSGASRHLKKSNNAFPADVYTTLSNPGCVAAVMGHSAQAALANTLFHMKVRRSELLELPWV
jgi:hypothetical protein